MNQQHPLSIWLAIIVIVVGIGSLLLLGIQPQVTASGTMINGGGLLAQPQPTNAPVPSTLVPFTDTASMTDTLPLTVSVTPTFTPLAPLILPNVTVPDGGQAYLLTPMGPEMVGWVQDQDETVNHFGDYNMYAGFFGGQPRVGAMQFDLASVPLGSPILYADLTLTGLADEWLVEGGLWQVDLLAEWLDKDWAKRDFHWLARPDSGIVPLEPRLASIDLAIGQSNTLLLPPAALTQLEARLFKGLLSFRITGPIGGTDNLYAWDSGFGARTSGRGPVLRIVTGGPAPAVPPPSPTPDYVIITLTPTNESVLVTLAAESMTATAQATPIPITGTPQPTVTPTSFPPNWVTPVLITNTPTPENAATAAWQVQVATAQALVRKATPPNIWTTTPTPLPPLPTPTPMIVAYDRLTPTATATATPGVLPAVLSDKILFWSDRTGNANGVLMIMNADGSNVTLWTGEGSAWAYEQARQNKNASPDGGFRVVVSSEQIRTSQLWVINLADRTRRQLTDFNEIAYDPVWSPTGNRIAFVSPESGNDELYVINADGTGLTQLTYNDWEWDKYPSWSPDGQQLAFWSNRESRRKQIWIMNVDGSNVRNLSNNQYNDWEPVWVTSLTVYPGLAEDRP